MSWLMDRVSYKGDDCLIWPFATARGYGVVTHNGHQRVAANLMCELAHGAAPSTAHETAHSCGRGGMGCVNPRHLRWATRIENRADMLIHGVRPMGERMGTSKLTESDVREIRNRKAAGARAEDIAERFGVSRATVFLIANRQRWGWLE